jgi:hypothetical protein
VSLALLNIHQFLTHSRDVRDLGGGACSALQTKPFTVMGWPSRDASGSFGLSTAMMNASAGQESCAAGIIQPSDSQGICRGRIRGEYRPRRAPTDVRQETNINRVPDGGTENSPQERASSDAAACRGSNSASLLRSGDSEDARSLAPPRDVLPRSESTFQYDLAIVVGDDEDPTARSPLGASDSSGDDVQSLAMSVGVAPGGGTTTLIPKDLLDDRLHGDARTDVLPDRHHGADQLTTQLILLNTNYSAIADEHTSCALGDLALYLRGGGSSRLPKPATEEQARAAERLLLQIAATMSLNSSELDIVREHGRRRVKEGDKPVVRDWRSHHVHGAFGRTDRDYPAADQDTRDVLAIVDFITAALGREKYSSEDRATWAAKVLKDVAFIRSAGNVPNRARRLASLSDAHTQADQAFVRQILVKRHPWLLDSDVPDVDAMRESHVAKIMDMYHAAVLRSSLKQVRGEYRISSTANVPLIDTTIKYSNMLTRAIREEAANAPGGEATVLESASVRAMAEGSHSASTTAAQARAHLTLSSVSDQELATYMAKLKSTKMVGKVCARLIEDDHSEGYNKQLKELTDLVNERIVKATVTAPIEIEPTVASTEPPTTVNLTAAPGSQTDAPTARLRREPMPPELRMTEETVEALAKGPLSDTLLLSGEDKDRVHARREEIRTEKYGSLAQREVRDQGTSSQTTMEDKVPPIQLRFDGQGRDEGQPIRSALRMTDARSVETSDDYALELMGLAHLTALSDSPGDLPFGLRLVRFEGLVGTDTKILDHITTLELSHLTSQPDKRRFFGKLTLGTIGSAQAQTYALMHGLAHAASTAVGISCLREPHAMATAHDANSQAAHYDDIASGVYSAMLAVTERSIEFEVDTKLYAPGELDRLSTAGLLHREIIDDEVTHWYRATIPAMHMLLFDSQLVHRGASTPPATEGAKGATGEIGWRVRSRENPLLTEPDSHLRWIPNPAGYLGDGKREYSLAASVGVHFYGGLQRDDAPGQRVTPRRPLRAEITPPDRVSPGPASKGQRKRKSTVGESSADDGVCGESARSTNTSFSYLGFTFKTTDCTSSEGDLYQLAAPHSYPVTFLDDWYVLLDEPHHFDDPWAPFVIYPDASDFTIGGALMQRRLAPTPARVTLRGGGKKGEGPSAGKGGDDGDADKAEKDKEDASPTPQVNVEGDGKAGKDKEEDSLTLQAIAASLQTAFTAFSEKLSKEFAEHRSHTQTLVDEVKAGIVGRSEIASIVGSVINERIAESHQEPQGAGGGATPEGAYCSSDVRSALGAGTRPGRAPLSAFGAANAQWLRGGSYTQFDWHASTNANRGGDDNGRTESGIGGGRSEGTDNHAHFPGGPTPRSGMRRAPASGYTAGRYDRMPGRNVRPGEDDEASRDHALVLIVLADEEQDPTYTNLFHPSTVRTSGESPLSMVLTLANHLSAEPVESLDGIRAELDRELADMRRNGSPVQRVLHSNQQLARPVTVRKDGERVKLVMVYRLTVVCGELLSHTQSYDHLRGLVSLVNTDTDWDSFDAATPTSALLTTVTRVATMPLVDEGPASLAAALAYVLQGAPYKRGDHTSRRHADDTTSGDHTGYSKRRTKWSEEPGKEIAQALPEMSSSTTSIQSHHHSLLMALHGTESASLLPLLVKEAKPLSSIFRALLLTHYGNSMAKGKLGQAEASTSLTRRLADLESRHGECFNTARDDPENPDHIADVYDVLCKMLTAIRAAYLSSTPDGVLSMESQMLTERLERPTSMPDAEYIDQVDNAFTHVYTLWGPAQMLEMCEQGVLTQFMPLFVNNLSETHRRLAFEYLNNMLNTLVSDGVIEKLIPQDREIIEKSLNARSMHMPVQSEVRTLARLRKRPGAYDDLVAFENRGNHSHWKLSNPHDLYFLGQTGLVFTHWRALIYHLRGPNAMVGIAPREAHPSRSTINEVAEHIDGDDAAGDVDMFAVQTRGSAPFQRRPRPPQGGPPSDKSPLERRSQGEDARWEQLQRKHDQQIERLGETVKKAAEDTVRRHQTQVNKELAHHTETISKLLGNLAGYTSLGNSSRIRAAAHELGTPAPGASALVAAAAAAAPPTPRGDFKYEKFEDNKYSEFPAELKTLLASYGVRDERDYEKAKARLCSVCPADSIRMPHALGKCPGCKAFTAEGEQRMGKVMAARHRQRLKKPSSTVAEVIAMLIEEQEVDLVDMCHSFIDSHEPDTELFDDYLVPFPSEQ